MTGNRYILLAQLELLFSIPAICQPQPNTELFTRCPQGLSKGKKKQQNKPIPNCRHTDLCTQGYGWAHLSDKPEARKDLMKPPGGA